jgi:hypothetical protein
MPQTSIATHPSGLQITFHEEGHQYIDSAKQHYTSGTGLLKPYFPPFEADKVAAIVAERENKTIEQVKAEWEWASESGTRLHENCENQFKNRFDLFHQPQNENELAAFQCAFNTVQTLQTQLRWIGCELIVFDPRMYIAGTIDLLMYDPARDVYLILDFKKCKAIYSQGFNGEKAHHPISYLESCNQTKYGLQLSLYQFIMQANGYLPPQAKVERFLIHFAPMAAEPVFIPTPDYRKEVLEVLLWNAYDMSREIPGVPF